MYNLFVGPSDSFISGQSIAFRMLTDYESRNKIAGTKSVTLHNSAGGGALYKLFYMFYFAFKLIMTCIRQRPSVVYLSISRSLGGFMKDLPVFLLAFLSRSKVCIHLHGSDFKDFYRSTGKFSRWIVDFCYQRVSVAFVLCDGMHSEFEDIPGISVVTVFNCAPDLGKLKASVDAEEQMNILYMSNVIRTKGILELIDAVKTFHSEHGRISLKIAGDFVADELMGAAEIRAAFFEMISGSEFISYEGIVKGIKKDQLFEWSNIVALPSYYRTEAQPLVLIEAMSCGRFVLSSAHKYIPEFIADKENGILLTSVTKDSLLVALKNINSGKANYTQVCENNREYYKNNFTESVHCERILNSIKNLN